MSLVTNYIIFIKQATIIISTYHFYGEHNNTDDHNNDNDDDDNKLYSFVKVKTSAEEEHP